MQIRTWFLREKFSVEDAFRALDKHYDGDIGEDDLYNFLKDVIKIKVEDLNKVNFIFNIYKFSIQGKVNRLFKLIDTYKRGKISIADWNRLLTEDFT